VGRRVSVAEIYQAAAALDIKVADQNSEAVVARGHCDGGWPSHVQGARIGAGLGTKALGGELARSNHLRMSRRLREDEARNGAN